MYSWERGNFRMDVFFSIIKSMGRKYFRIITMVADLLISFQISLFLNAILNVHATQLLVQIEFFKKVYLSK